MKPVKLTNMISIGEGYPVFVIAEAGINHNGSVKTAKRMIDAAARCGANAVKFQTFKAEEFISTPSQTITYKSQGKWITESAITMFKRYQFSPSQWREVADHCKKKRIVFFSTPQNPSDLDMLLKVTGMQIIKVGSDDLTNLDLMKYYASKKKPMIISAGMAYRSEISDAISVIRKAGNNELSVLHCVASYPASPEQVNMRKMNAIADIFNVIPGFSDHTEGIDACVVAAAMGAKVIEKHFTLGRDLPGPDHWFSSDPKELKALVKAVRKTELMMGTAALEPTKKEMNTRKDARRSIVARTDIIKGMKISSGNVEFKRPGTGLPPKMISKVLNRTAKRTVIKGSVIKMGDLS
jgi:N,N'-diacetyllegionaminate synthase